MPFYVACVITSFYFYSFFLNSNISGEQLMLMLNTSVKRYNLQIVASENVG